MKPKKSSLLVLLTEELHGWSPCESSSIRRHDLIVRAKTRIRTLETLNRKLKKELRDLKKELGRAIQREKFLYDDKIALENKLRKV